MNIDVTDLTDTIINQCAKARGKTKTKFIDGRELAYVRKQISILFFLQLTSAFSNRAVSSTDQGDTNRAFDIFLDFTISESPCLKLIQSACISAISLCLSYLTLYEVW